ncbi:hypothetical protein PpBr36_03848 [Pyricularia pennisetigena]|uniref:hypothetical protein n=1 Tax=Pyricularia pennisetigena TaxID=1578925 RepID=UPI001151F075|nr:hypothetical protein PpBr36_03848 [Pyricularia pennisetigena]TLS30109.1 hypothetical protein PpBr36_03848 [Pyricularia pennisetigena]
MEVNNKAPEAISMQGLDGGPRETDQESIYYKQTRTRRLFSEKQLFALNVVMYGACYYVGTNTYLVMLNGGPRAWLFSFFFVAAGVACQVASFAELASIQPIAGAQYYWTFNYAPPSVNVFLTWLQGWSTWLGYVSMISSNVTGGVITMQGIINIAKPEWVPAGWQTTLITLAYLSLCTALNLWWFRAVPWFETMSGILNALLFVVVVIIVWTMAPRAGMDVFLIKSNAGGWGDFVSYNIGSISNLFLFIAFESIVHLGEETRNPKRAVPSSMFWGFLAKVAMAFVMIITFGSAFPGIDVILTSVSPLATFINYATSSPNSSIAILSCMLFSMVAASIGNFWSISRLTWAWARGGGLPKYFAMVDGKPRIPMRAVSGTALIIALLSLLFPNDRAFIAIGAIGSLSSISLYVSYIIGLGCIIYFRLANPGCFQRGEWSCGRLGLPVNIFALIYTGWEVVWLPFPNALPVAGANMNYAGPVYVALLVMAVSYWFSWARRHWEGPNMKVVEIVLQNDDASK